MKNKSNRGIKVALVLVAMFALLAGCSSKPKSGLTDQEIATMQVDNKSMKEQIEAITNKIQVREETMTSLELQLLNVVDPYKGTALEGKVESLTLIMEDKNAEKPSIFELSIEDGPTNSLLSAVIEGLEVGKNYKVIFVGINGMSDSRTIGKVARIEPIN